MGKARRDHSHRDQYDAAGDGQHRRAGQHLALLRERGALPARDQEGLRRRPPVYRPIAGPERGLVQRLDKGTAFRRQGRLQGSRKGGRARLRSRSQVRRRLLPRSRAEEGPERLGSKERGRPLAGFGSPPSGPKTSVLYSRRTSATLPTAMCKHREGRGPRSHRRVRLALLAALGIVLPLRAVAQSLPPPEAVPPEPPHEEPPPEAPPSGAPPPAAATPDTQPAPVIR